MKIILALLQMIIFRYSITLRDSMCSAAFSFERNWNFAGPSRNRRSVEIAYANCIILDKFHDVASHRSIPIGHCFSLFSTLWRFLFLNLLTIRIRVDESCLRNQLRILCISEPYLRTFLQTRALHKPPRNVEDILQISRKYS